ncbi:bifunctional hydroxymethylpyrimidine kinase/phosphomethylpyrimidine kinase [Dactylosporangium sp. AC04546]|uniref:bifunctional hydroxymethylpyrimidine kinase/phosphomethylpyrimidine kinase n=1 Tax=Dactylosporangium sp. AC04546 TaxID=2862460 RepID=UPI001EDE83AE|nr:bifunctional hydroxymethylpyrimidine kinase/phosphomethylpyrimidine kinase [Dactylosporangium sp. AC04546]WVK83173.1 bifunctional hydroxymethylpyrimidine kinase/phosphomethylpyrimidine kinase [Dactylosporangium sp. AC04546]
MEPTVVLTIGATDSSGGSALQADLRTLAALRMHAACVVTAVLSRNTRGTTDVYAQPTTVVAAQLGSVLEDLPVAAVKTGMFPTAEAVITVAARARAGALPNLVVDPVLATTSGSRRGLIAAFERLLPHAAVVTPNREEASALLGWEVVTPADMAGAAAQLAAGGPPYVVITGGDFVVGGEAIDVLWADGAARVLHSPRITSRNTDGSGPTFATAIAARLAAGDAPPDAVVWAKGFVGRAIGDAAEWRIGAGTGPIDQFGWSALTLR